MRTDKEADTAKSRPCDDTAYAELFDLAPVGYLTLNRNDIILQANHAAADLLGVERGQLPSRTFSSFVQRDAQADWLRHQQQVLLGNERQTFELDCRAASGTPFAASLDCRPHPGATDEEWRAMVTVTDITERKHDQEVLRRINEDLDRRGTERTRELIARGHVSTVASRDLHLDVTVSNTLKSTTEVTRSDLAMLFLREGDSIVLQQTYEKGDLPPHASPDRRPLGECLCGLAARGEPVYSTDIAADARCVHAECHNTGLTSFAAIPLKANGNVVGVLCIGATEQVDFRAHAAFLANLARDVSLAVRNAILYQGELEQADDLRDREQEYAVLADNSPDVIMRFDRAHRHLYVNKAVRGVTGRDAAEFIGKTHAEMGLPEDVCRHWDRCIERVFETGAPHHDAFELADEKSTRSFEWHLVPEHKAGGKAETVLAVSRDVTAERRAEERLRRSEQRFRLLVENAPDGIALNAADGTILYESPAISRILGYTADELVGRRYQDLVHPDDLRTTEEHVQPRLLTNPGAPVYTQMRLRHKDGSWRVLGVTSANHLETRGMEGIVVNFRDLTQHVQAEQQKTEVEQQLTREREQAVRADRLRSLGEMAAGMAHELNQPLGGLRALAEQNLLAVSRGWELKPEELKEELSLMVEQADRMTHIINHVRVFSREASHEETQAVDLNDVVTSALDLVGEQLRIHGVTVDLQLESALRPVQANPFSLEEVLINLISNARQALDPQRDAGTAHIAIRTLMAGSGEEGWVHLELSDNGSGMEPEVLAKAFEPFFTTKGPADGTGLGLSIVRSIVKEAGGTIALNSAPGVGTTVTVRLPSLPQEARAAKEEANHD